MKSNYTHVTIVLDRSGSMAHIANDTIGGFNQFIEDQKRVPGDCTAMLVQFDDIIETVFEPRPLAEVPLLDQHNYKPRNWTALYDAMGFAINQTGKFLKNKPASERPAKVVFVTITDGHENASHQFSHERVREMIGHQRDVYKWQFVFLGANIDSYDVGASLNISAGNTMNFAANTASTQAMYAATSDNLRRYRTGAKAAMDFEDHQKDKQKQAGANQ